MEALCVVSDLIQVTKNAYKIKINKKTVDNSKWEWYHNQAVSENNAKQHRFHAKMMDARITMKIRNT